MTQIKLKFEDCNRYPYSGIDKELTALLRDPNLRINTNDNGFRKNRYSNEPPVWDEIKVERLYLSVDGFTADEYSKITGQPVPNRWYKLVQTNCDGKVCTYEENGNISILRGASTYSKKGVLITQIWGKDHDINIIIE